jgi:micrococcal nuclease
MNRIHPISIALLIFLLGAGCHPAGTTQTMAAILGTASDTPSPEGSAVVTVASSCVPARFPREEATVRKAVDGDTIEVDRGGVPFRVRYIGMDAPELSGEPMAAESLEANRRLVEGKRIVMVRDLSEADRYGRLLRFVFAGGIFVNSELVRLGLARAMSYPPDVSCDAEFRSAESEARAARRGLWGIAESLTFAEGKVGDYPTPPAGCRIKGNISAGGEKIYHVPGGKYYDQTVIEPEKGERWFCSEAEAVAAGWRRSKK